MSSGVKKVANYFQTNYIPRFYLFKDSHTLLYEGNVQTFFQKVNFSENTLRYKEKIKRKKEGEQKLGKLNTVTVFRRK